MVAIVGGGAAGIIAARTALKFGLKPTIFTKDPSIGGAWNLKTGLMWDKMVTNISRHHMQFSDFPWPERTVDFPPAREVHWYLQSYVRHFQLEPHFQYHTEVQSIYQTERGWKVEREEYPFVLICSGMLSRPYVPPALKGAIHSSDYKNGSPFQGKTVAVIGNSFSGCEIAAELAGSAAKVLHIFRKARWIMPRYLPGHIPWDLAFHDPKAASPEKSDAEKHARLATLSTQEEISPLLIVNRSTPPFVAISDSYLSAVQAGQITLRKGEEIKESVDTVIACTGYQTSLPFFSPEILSSLAFDPKDAQPVLLHKTVFHPALPNLGFIGLYRGPYFSVMEKQAAWACRVFRENLTVPFMEQGIEEARLLRYKTPPSQYPYKYLALERELGQAIS